MSQYARFLILFFTFSFSFFWLFQFWIPLLRIYISFKKNPIDIKFKCYHSAPHSIQTKPISMFSLTIHTIFVCSSKSNWNIFQNQIPSIFNMWDIFQIISHQFFHSLWTSRPSFYIENRDDIELSAIIFGDPFNGINHVSNELRTSLGLEWSEFQEKYWNLYILLDSSLLHI